MVHTYTDHLLLDPEQTELFRLQDVCFCYFLCLVLFMSLLNSLKSSQNLLSRIGIFVIFQLFLYISFFFLLECSWHSVTLASGVQLSDLTSLYTSWSIHRKCRCHLSRYITIMISSLHISLTALITTLNGQFFDMCIILPTRTKASRRQASCQSCLPLQSQYPVQCSWNILRWIRWIILISQIKRRWRKHVTYPKYTDSERQGLSL